MLQRDDILAAYDAYIRPQSTTTTTRRKLAMHLVSQKTRNDTGSERMMVREDGEANFKAGLMISAAAVPVRQVQEVLLPRL